MLKNLPHHTNFKPQIRIYFYFQNKSDAEINIYQIQH